jgi:hypothetical protein
MAVRSRIEGVVPDLIRDRWPSRALLAGKRLKN